MSTTSVSRAPRRTPLYIHISAWAIPVMVVGQFAMLAIVPVAVVLIGGLVDSRVRPLRWWAGLLAAVYATPLLVWMLRHDRAQSLSRDIHPAFVAVIAVVSIALLLKIYTRRRR